MTKRIVCILGPDASGKSTLTNALLEKLQGRGMHASRIWILEGESTVIRRVLRAVTGRRRRSVSAPALRQSSKRGVVRTIYPRLVLWDYLRSTSRRMQRSTRGDGFLLLDRYWYDVVFAVCREFSLSEKTLRVWVARFQGRLPAPDFVFALDIAPDEMLKRKPEEFKGLGMAVEKWKAFQEMWRRVQGTLKNAESLDARLDRGALVQHVLGRLGFQDGL